MEHQLGRQYFTAFEQYRFELREFTYRQTFFYKYTVALHVPQLLILRFKPKWIENSICNSRPETLDAEGQLSALVYAILYQGPEHPQILVSIRGGFLEPIPHRYQGLL